MTPDARKTLLLVEDEYLLAMGEAQQLEGEGYRVIHAATGERAIEIVDSGEPIDLVLMDIDLGEGAMSGTDAAETILERLDLPLLFLSSHTEKEVVDKTEEITNYGYVVKNSSFTVLDASIKMALKLFQATKKLVKGEERFRLSMGVTQDGIWDRDLTKGEVYYSPAYFRMLGYEAGDISRMTDFWEDLIHPDDRAMVLERNRDCRDNACPGFDIEFRMRAKSGTWKWVQSRGSAVSRDGSGIATRMIGTHTDITVRKQAEEALRASEAEFNRLLERTQSLLAEKELILREVHHRVKNNLHTISSLLFLQTQTLKEASAIEALNEAIRRVQSFGVLYERLHLSGNFNDLSVKDYLPSLIDEIVGNFPNSPRVAIEKRIEDFSLDVQHLQPLGIIINELLTNIMKYAFAGRESGVVRVHAGSAGERIRLCVEDDGVGIPEGIDFGHSGGLGLTLVGQLADQLDGTIRIERGGGTRVILEFDRP